jgi:hypothetical protein
MPTPTPTAVLNFSAGLPSGVTFTRSGASTAIVNGVITTIGDGVPAIESWGAGSGVPKGLRICGSGGTNLVHYSNQFLNLVNMKWYPTGLTLSTGNLGPDGVTDMILTTQPNAFSYQNLQPTDSIAAVSGQQVTISLHARLPIGSTAFTIQLGLCQYGFNNFSAGVFRIDQPGSACFFDRSAEGNNFIAQSARIKTLANGVFRCEMTGTWTFTGGGTLFINTNLDNNYLTTLGVSTNTVEIWGCQVTATPQAIAYLDNPGTGVASMNAESASIPLASITGFLSGATAGTFLIKHNITSGVILGSGANAIVTADGTAPSHSYPGRPIYTAYTWNSAGGSLVSNGGAVTNTTVAGIPALFGTNLQLLGTSAATNTGNILEIDYYPSRLSDSVAQGLTAPPSLANPGVYRFASLSRFNRGSTQLSQGTGIQAFVCRLPIPIVCPDGDSLSNLVLDFANWAMALSSVGIYPPDEGNTAYGDRLPGNSVIIDKLALESTSGTPIAVPVTYGGGRTLTMANGSSNNCNDPILPSQFGVASFTNDQQYYIRIQGHLPAPGNWLPGSRSIRESYPSNTGPLLTGVFGQSYDPSITVFSNVDATGPFTNNGTGSVNNLPWVPCPIVTGQFNNGADPITPIIAGDSILESIDLWGLSWLSLACYNNHFGSLVFCRGSASAYDLASSTRTQNYFKYGRLFIDQFGKNDEGGITYQASIYALARSLGVEKVIHIGPTPDVNWLRTDGTSGYNDVPRFFNYTQQQGLDVSSINKIASAYVSSGVLDASYIPTSASDTIGSVPALWLVDGTDRYATQDGVHPTQYADQVLLANELTAWLAGITVSAPVAAFPSGIDSSLIGSMLIRSYR